MEFFSMSTGKSNSDANKRAANFTKSEENMLILLVKKYSSIIENKKTDSCMNQRKNATWTQITTEFNCAGGDTYRSMQILKNKYLNLKKKSLKKISDEKKKTYKTGGGPPVVATDTELDNSLREIIGTRMTGLTSHFDSDSMVEIECEVQNEQEEEMEDDINYDHTYFTDEVDVPVPVQIETKIPESILKDLNCETVDWSINSVENLRTPVSTKLQVNNPKDVRKRDNTLKSKLSIWAKSKQDFVTIQQQCLLNESTQKLRHNEEKHKEEMKQKQEVHAEKLQMMRDEHIINIKILKLKHEKIIREMSD